MKIKWTSTQPWEKLNRPKIEGDVGYDLAWSPDDNRSELLLHPGNKVNLRTGISIQLPKGTWAQILPRSSGVQNGLYVMGVIDNGWRGELFVAAWNISSRPIRIKNGDRVGQMVIMPSIVFDIEQVDELDKSKRGTNGFGSTGR